MKKFDEKEYQELFAAANLDGEQILKLQDIFEKMIAIAVQKANKAQIISNNRRSDPGNSHPEDYDIPYYTGKADGLNAAFHAISGTLYEQTG
jgi:hypothetical protein